MFVAANLTCWAARCKAELCLYNIIVHNETVRYSRVSFCQVNKTYEITLVKRLNRGCLLEL